MGDFGFILGIAAIVMYFGSLDYREVFELAMDPSKGFADKQIDIFGGVSLMSAIGILLFIGAMGKSAQVPLHVWLPDSMEGPTPISALIHAATMVTAGIFMVARMSPLYELSETALSFVLVIRCHHRFLHWPDRHSAERYQTGGGLFDPVTAGLHDGGAGRIGLCPLVSST